MNQQILLIALPLLLSFLSLMIKNKAKELLYLAGIVNVVLLTIVNKGVTVIGGFEAPFGITLVVDNYSYIGIWIINVLFLMTLIISKDSIKNYASVLLVAMAGLNGMILTGDIFNLFVFLEITSITAYILASKNDNYKNAFHYLVIGTLGSGLFLFGVALLYGMFGTLNMSDLSEQINMVDASVITVPVFMIFIGLAVETKLMPFSSWVKGVLGDADDLVGPLIATAYAATTLMVFGRLFSQVFIIDSSLKIVLLTITILTLLLGEFAAFSRSKIREVLLFSSIAQAGLVATLFISGLVFPAVLQLINNVFSKLVLFSITGKIAQDTETDEIDSLRGIFIDNKLIGVSFTIASLSLLGLPLFFGFYSKMNVMFGFFSQNSYLLPGIILFSTIIEGAYFIRMLVNLWNTGEEGEKSEASLKTKSVIQLSKYKTVGVLFISVVLILMGLVPSLLMDNFYSDQSLLNEIQPEYIFEIEGGM